MLFLLIFVFTLVLQFILPWWIVAPIAFLLSLWKAKNGKHAFVSAFFAAALCWAGVSLFKSIPNENMLANKIGQLLGLPEFSFNWLMVVLITAIIGGLAAGFSGLAGYYWRNVMK